MRILEGKVRCSGTIISVIYLLMFQRVYCFCVYTYYFQALSRETYKFPSQVVAAWHLHRSGFLLCYSIRSRSYFIEGIIMQENNLGFPSISIKISKSILIKIKKLFLI